MLNQMSKPNVVYKSNFYSQKECEYIIDKLSRISFDENSTVKIRGQTINIPRKQVAFGDNGTLYAFSGSIVKPKYSFDDLPILDKIRRDMEDELVKLLPPQDLVNDDLYILNHRVNFCLINKYRDGKDYIGAHSDDEKDLISICDKFGREGPIIFSLSFGASRDFIFHPRNSHSSSSNDKNDTREKVTYCLNDGDLIIMLGDTQQKWKHSVPKRLKVTEPRYNLTFRIMQ